MNDSCNWSFKNAGRLEDCVCSCGYKNHGIGNVAITQAYLRSPAKERQEAGSKIRDSVDRALDLYNKQADPHPHLQPSRLTIGTAKNIGATTTWLLAGNDISSPQSLEMSLATEMIDALWDAFFSASNWAPQRRPCGAVKRMLHHFVCGIIAELAKILRESSDILHQLEDAAAETTAATIAELVISSRETEYDSAFYEKSCGKLKSRHTQDQRKSPQTHAPLLTDAEAKRLTIAILEPVFKKIITAYIELPSDQVLEATRLMAIIICPAPDEHELVWEECWHPLAEDFIHSLFSDLAMDIVTSPTLNPDLLQYLQNLCEKKLESYKNDFHLLKESWKTLQNASSSSSDKSICNTAKSIA